MSINNFDMTFKLRWSSFESDGTYVFNKLVWHLLTLWIKTNVGPVSKYGIVIWAHNPADWSRFSR